MAPLQASARRGAPCAPRLALAAAAVPLMIAVCAPAGHAAAPCEPVAARIVSLQGRVEVRAAGAVEWTVITLHDGLCFGDTVRVGALSRAALELPENPTLRLDQLTTLRLVGITESGNSWLDLLAGVVHFFSRRPHALQVDTPVANAGTEGTEFLMRVAEGRTEVVTFEGRVRLTTPDGELLVASGDAGLALAGRAPVREIVARPRDAVAWTLYYPPILAPLAEQGAAPALLPAGLARAVERVAANDYPGAIAALDAVPADARDARYFTYRAGVLLNVGQAGLAEEALARALELDPAAADTLAERAVLRVVQNRREDALADAQRAVELSPDSAPARIALSYALQSMFELKAARAALREATSRSPEDALAWARLAELEQSFGDLDASQRAAERAVALAPGLARTQMVLGFAALTRIDIDQAKAAFERAIDLDSALPLARLGQGLAKIRAGDLDAGAVDLEIAVALDPDDALLRSYLGKAYFEERRGPLDAEQFQIAKELDPNDPTPWFYDAIRLQTENRPVEALRSLEKSIALNDNRAVYRSRLLLDDDRATRDISLARIYDDLGFEQLGLLEASRSLRRDPANYSAHRFLSDTYANLPRHEIARASELLQAQLLQPININPIQPSRQVFDLNVLEGGGTLTPGANEFSSLFERNRAQLAATGFVGTNSTLGDELIASAVWNRLSLSAGQFHSQTDGFRSNNDINNNLVNLFSQYYVNPRLSVQAEFRRRETDQGDVELSFDPDSFLPNLREDIRQDTARVGGRYDTQRFGSVILSGVYTDFTNKIDNPDFFGLELENDQKGYQLEGQNLINTSGFSLTSGAGIYTIDQNLNADTDISEPASGPDRIDHFNIYTYSNIEYPETLTWTLGLSYDDYNEKPYEKQQVNPKFGLTWEVSPDVVLRFAALRTLARARSLNQTIEPTTIAGFNQFFDDFQGTDAWQYGAAIDTRVTPTLSLGAQYSYRKLDGPIVIVGESDTETAKQDEMLGKLYAYWMPTSNWAFQAGIDYERFKQKTDDNSLAQEQEVETWLAPIGASYFSPSGWFAQVLSTLVWQQVELEGENLGDDLFPVVDAAVGYRLKGRRGTLSLEALNIFDQGFHYQDLNFRTSESLNPRFVPDSILLARINLVF